MDIDGLDIKVSSFAPKYSLVASPRRPSPLCPTSIHGIEEKKHIKKHTPKRHTNMSQGRERWMRMAHRTIGRWTKDKPKDRERTQRHESATCENKKKESKVQHHQLQHLPQTDSKEISKRQEEHAGKITAAEGKRKKKGGRLTPCCCDHKAKTGELTQLCP